MVALAFDLVSGTAVSAAEAFFFRLTLSLNR